MKKFTKQDIGCYYHLKNDETFDWANPQFKLMIPKGTSVFLRGIEKGKGIFNVMSPECPMEERYVLKFDQVERGDYRCKECSRHYEPQRPSIFPARS